MDTVIQRARPEMRYGAPFLFAVSLLASTLAHAFESGSTGADGALNLTVNTEIELPPSGVLNYTTVNIPSGITVTFRKNAANTPVYLLATGDVTIAGVVDIQGGTAAATGSYGDGVLGDDGIPGTGGPGGYDGGRGGRNDIAQRVDIIRGGTGLGPGGGEGGIEGGDGCGSNRYHKYVGTGGAYARSVYAPRATHTCSGLSPLGVSYGSILLQPLIGGSGGGGGRGGTDYPGSGGGGGGGAILIASSGTIRVTGTINARGGDGGGLAGTNAGGQGAGGSGGAIRLVADTITGGGGLYAEGGCIHAGNTARQYCGSDGGYYQYGGSEGRIRLEANAITFSGTSAPTRVVDTPGPVFISGAPSLRIASVDGQPVPANPTGHADITLPADTTGPVSITFESVNVPVGNTVNLRVVPAYGHPIEALSPAIAGSTASGSTAVEVTLPAGPSVLQATTTYTVVVAGGPDLSHFARNEAVEKVEVTVRMDGEPSARVVTVSGKAYDAPYMALRAAGFAG